MTDLTDRIQALAWWSTLTEEERGKINVNPLSSRQIEQHWKENIK